MKKSIFLLLSVLILCCASTAFAAWPEDKPIEVIIPFAVGGANDILIRFLIPDVAEALGQSVVPVNRPGGGAVIGQAEVAKAKPDGYKLLAANATLVPNTITKKVPFTIDSYEPIIMFCADPNILIVNADSEIKSMADLIRLAKEGRTFTVGTSGHSTSHHIVGLLLAEAIGAKFDYVHTSGGTQQSVMLAGGHIDLNVGAYGSCSSLVEQGKLRVIGTTAETRHPLLPDVPSFREEGIDIVFASWRGAAAPAGTPKEIVDKLHAAFKTALDNPEVQKKFRDIGFPVEYKGPEDLREFMQSEYESIKKIEPLLRESK